MCKHQTKGNLIAVIGRVQTRSYDGNDGNRKYATDIQYLESKGSRANGKMEHPEPQQGSEIQNEAPANTEYEGNQVEHYGEGEQIVNNRWGRN
nr:single-stranded DNA-binding protein [Listeria booriae]